MQQNFVNPTHTGPDRWQITESRSYRQFFCYCCYTWAVQLIRAVFCMNISFYLLVQDHQGPLLCFLELYCQRTSCSRRNHNTWRTTDILGRHLLLTCLWDLTISFMQPLSGKKSKFLVLELLSCSARLSDFRITGHCINRILLYMEHSFLNCCHKLQQMYEIFLSQGILNSVPNWLVLFDTTVPVLILLDCYLKFKLMSQYVNINWKYFQTQTWSLGASMF